MGRQPNPVSRTEPTPAERAYLAGLVDAEGHFGYRTDPLKLKFCLTGRERDLLEQVVAWAFGEVFPQPPGAIRPRTLRNRVECKLEKWGLIQPDPFRHIEG